MTMKGLEAEKPLVGKSESAAPQFDVMKLMGEFKQLHGDANKQGKDQHGKQTESSSDVLKQSEKHSPQASGQLDMGTMADLYGDNSHTAHGRHQAKQENNVDDVLNQLKKAAAKTHKDNEENQDDGYAHPTYKQLQQMQKEMHAEFQRTVRWVDSFDKLQPAPKRPEHS